MDLISWVRDSRKDECGVTWLSEVLEIDVVAVLTVARVSMILVESLRPELTQDKGIWTSFRIGCYECFTAGLLIIKGTIADLIYNDILS